MALDKECTGTLVRDYTLCVIVSRPLVFTERVRRDFNTPRVVTVGYPVGIRVGSDEAA